VSTTNPNIIQESPAPRADEHVRVLADVNVDSLVGDKKTLTEVVNEESELAKKCGANTSFEKWHPEPLDLPHCDGIPVTPTKRVDIPSDKGIFG
jgi:hypothetical protein